jgi:hypothetical protein
MKFYIERKGEQNGGDGKAFYGDILKINLEQYAYVAA